MRLYPRRKRNGTTVWWATWTENKVTIKRSTRQPTRELAKLVADRWARLRADPELEAPRQATFGGESSIFLKECRASKRKPATVTMYEQKLANLCDVLGRSTSMADVTADRVAGYFTQRQEEGAAGSTLFKEWVALKGVLESAWRRGKYRHDPRKVRPSWVTPDYEPRTTYLTWEQADAILAALPVRRRRVVAFVLATGARRGEWVRAIAGDVDQESHKVRIRGTKTKAAATVLRVPKLMHRWLAIAGQPPFDRWPNARRDLHAVARTLDPEETRAARERGEPTDDLPKFPRVTWNDLRRTFASLLIQGGVANHHVAKMLRHTTTAMVDRVYGQQTEDTLGDLVDASFRDPSVTHPDRT